MNKKHFGVLVLFFLIFGINSVYAQKKDSNALKILNSTVDRTKALKSLTYSLQYSFTDGNERVISIKDIDVSYINMVNKDSLLYYLPKAYQMKLETKDSIYIYNYKSSEYVTVLSKPNFHQHSSYNIQNVSIYDLLPDIDYLNGDGVDSIYFHNDKSNNCLDDYVIDVINKEKFWNNGTIKSKLYYNRYWINKKSMLPSKRQKFFHNINDLGEEQIQIDDFTISFPSRNPTTVFPLTYFKDSKYRITTPPVEEVNEKESAIIKQGVFAPNFSAKSILTGKVEDLSMYKGKVILLDFWYLSCPPCRELMPILNQVHKKYRDKDFLLLGINTFDKNANNIKKYIDSKSYEYKQWYLPSKVKELYGLKSAPTTVLIDKSGKIILVEEGYYDLIGDTLSKLIDEELKK